MPRSERPSLDELRTLLAVVDAGTETAAAKQLGITQPVVNRRLRVFRYGRMLVQTRANEVELTDAGQEALPAIRRLVQAYDHLQQFLAGRRREPNVLRVGIGSSASQFYLARALAGLQQRLPDWDVHTRVLRGQDRIAGVVDGTLDLAIVSHCPVQVDSIARWACRTRGELQIRELPRLPLCVIARHRTPEAEQLQSVLAGQTVPAALLGRWRLAGLDRESGVRQQLENLLRGRRLRLQFVQEAGGWLGVKEFVRQGLCAGLMPLALLSPDEQEQFVIRRLPTALAVSHRIVHRQDADSEALAEAKTALGQAADEFQREVERRWQGVL